MLAAYRHIIIDANTGWGMVVKIDESEAYISIQANIYNAVLLGVIGIIMILLFCLLFAERLSLPIRHLSNIAEMIKNGFFNVRSSVVSNDEVGALSNVFNSMAEQIENWHMELESKIKSRTASLKETNKELE